MSIRTERRDAAIERMADHLLREGLSGASLRPLAAAAGTSDRMLLYYFANRDELITATLERAAAKMAALLDSEILGDARLPFPELLGAVWSVVRSTKLRPYMRLWLELAAYSGRDQEPHRTIATAIIDGFVRWTSEHLVGDDPTERAQLSALLLATIDGAVFLDAAGKRNLADNAISAATMRYR